MLKPTMPLKNALAVAVLMPSIALAGPSNEWSEAWTPRTNATANNRLLQADLIEKKDVGYYDRIGINTTHYNGDFYITNDYRKGNWGDITATQGGEVALPMDNSDTTTTAIGAYNNTDNSVHVVGDKNSVDISNIANSRGDQDGSIRFRAGDDISTAGASVDTTQQGAR